jgi:hypothetical protein
MSVHIRVRVLSLVMSPFDRCVACFSLPPVGSVAAPCGSPAVPHVPRYYGVVRLLAHPSAPPSVDPRGPRTSQPSTAAREKMESSLGFLSSPCGSMPRARDSGDPGTSSHIGRCRILLSARLKASASQLSTDFGAESSQPASLLCTLRTHQSPGEWQHCLLNFGQAGLAPAGLQQEVSRTSSYVPPLPSLFPTR